MVEFKEKVEIYIRYLRLNCVLKWIVRLYVGILSILIS